MHVSQVTRRAEEVRTPGERFAGVRRIAVIRDDRLGDVVLSLPAVAALRRTYPDSRLALAVRAHLAPLARMVEGVDEVLEASSLKEFDADLTVSVSRGFAAAWGPFRAGVRHRVGTGRRFYSPLFDRRVPEHRRAGERHEVEYALSFAHRAGASGGPAVFPLRVPDEAGTSAAEWLRAHGIDRPFAVLHPGSGGSCPAWPAGHYARLSALLGERGVGVVLSVGPADAEVSRHLAGPRVPSGLPALAAILARARLFIGNSTGPLHLAAALGTPTLAFHAPWPSCGVSRWGPYAANGWAIEGDLAAIPPEFAAGCALDLWEGRAPSAFPGAEQLVVDPEDR